MIQSLTSKKVWCRGRGASHDSHEATGTVMHILDSLHREFFPIQATHGRLRLGSRLSYSSASPTPAGAGARETCNGVHVYAGCRSRSEPGRARPQLPLQTRSKHLKLRGIQRSGLPPKLQLLSIFHSNMLKMNSYTFRNISL